MKNLFNLFFAACCILLAASACTNQSVLDNIADLQNRVKSLEDRMDDANTNFSNLWEIVNSLNHKEQVNDITETSEAWIITFSGGKTVTVSKGTGLNVGMKKDIDNVYYWTLDGDWLLDNNGNKVPVSETLPTLTIQDDYWYISYDGGATWTQLGPARGEPGEPGDSIFQSVSMDESFFYITLANGEIIRLGRGIGGVKAITAIPDYSDGSVSVSKDLFTIRFAVVPEEAAENLASLSTDIYKFSVVYTNLTKASAGDEVDLQVVSQEARDGKLLLTVDGTALDDRFVYCQLGANAMLSVVYNENAMTSGFFPLQIKSNYIEVYDGDDLQEVIDYAPEGADIRVEAGASFDGTIYIWKNLRLSGGWINDFSRQDLRKRSVIDGHDMKCCVFSGSDKVGNRYGLDDVVLSGFEIRNGRASGVILHGKLTVEYCWIHNCFNSGQGGAIMSTERSGDELFLANSILEYNKADAHGGAVAMGGQGTKMTVVNCLFRGNASIAQYGYTGVIHGQAGAQAFICNNTIVDNVNWRDGSGPESTPWSTVMFRNAGTHAVFVNNIVAGNWYFLPGVANRYDLYPDRYDMPIKPMFIQQMQVQSIDMNILAGDDPDCVCRSNVLGGVDASNFIGRAGNGSSQQAAQDACTFVHNDDFYSIFPKAYSSDYHPAGPALTTGEASDLVLEILGPYTTDLDGKLRIVGGNITAGCYQPQ